MGFLTSLACYRRTDKKINTDIRQNLKIFNLRQKIREYQQNYFEHILRMPTYRMPRKIFNYHPKGRRDSGRPPMRWMEQFAQPGDRNRPIGLNLVVDDDDDDDDDEQ
jgi:hypothetical protein